MQQKLTLTSRLTMMTLTKVRSFIEYFLDQAFAVQARELTQAQTILQDQVERVVTIYLKMVPK